MRHKILVMALIICVILSFFVYHQTKFDSDDIILELQNVEYVEYGEIFDPMSLIKYSSGEVKCEENIDQYKIGRQKINFVVEEKGLTKVFSDEIEVKDTRAPKIELLKEKIVLKYAEQFDVKDNIKSVSDIVDGDLEYSKQKEDNCYTIESDVDYRKAGEYLVKVQAIDRNSNVSEKSFVVIVEKEDIKQNQASTKPFLPSYEADPNNRVIVIDPGHQEKGNSTKEAIGPNSTTMKAKVSSGTTGIASKIAESQINLDIGLQLKKELEARGYSVIMTRMSQSVNLSNQQRAKLGNENNAAAVIHLHCDGGPSSARGAHTIAVSKNNPYCPQLYSASSRLAKNVIHSYCQMTGIKNRGVSYRNDLTGLNWSQVPSIYLEMGFLSNKDEDLMLADHLFQDKCVKGIANGLDQYFK